ncbi:glycoside hydrolase family 31 protein [Aaosphaeria arxii CBS 175.79]|uniref:Glycoside hydrolase family 31 protein n=1 Tax=Aaosphaeria arxii CBS 175.79 TaxID=1450172 RepID=A0A6A5XPT8_9PLEO|nr:glycoside hydrolase family 31 protein [Aaosphaeria arxii CBS 175.79]KAF2014919.1 glycoside hydrolase family 31 protein [Aaosphaeria arxii CBS 175.79]
MPSSLAFIHSYLLFWLTLTSQGESTALRRQQNDCPGYKATNVERTDAGIKADLTLAGTECNIHGKDLKELRFSAEYQTDSRLHVIIYDKEEQVYQVPDFVVPRPTGSIKGEESALDVTIEEEPFSFTIKRKSNDEEIFSSKGSTLIFEDQYWRLRTSLPDNPSIYGLGEHTDSLRVPTSNYVRTLWNRDAGGVPKGENLYGAHPVYYEHRSESDNTHGVLLLNSNGMDIKINNDDGQYLEYNSLGGVIDLYFLAGPGPFDVAREYSEITQKAAMMPYWGLGFHQCRFGYKSVDEVAAVVQNYSDAGIPLETMWTDIDYMDEYKVFTLGQNFPLDKMRELVDRLHSNDQHYIVMVDPAVAYQDYDAFNNGKNLDIFLKSEDGSIYKGRVWPGVTAFPDWFHDKVQEYWDNEFQTFFNRDTGVDIDALWIDMNEPSNFCEWPCDNPEASQVDTDIINVRSISKRQEESGSKKGLPNRDLIDPSYQIKNTFGLIGNKTASTALIHQGGWTEYDTHNLYGSMMSKASASSMLKRRPDKRPMVITRSTFVGAGSYVGHWLGDNISAWDQYLASIRHFLQFVSIFQVPMAGADVCGFLGDTNEHLCARWTTLGAFYPFYRNHNVDGAISQEAYRWESVAAAARRAIDIRYRLLDYIYTAMHLQTEDGTPMITPVWFNYQSDSGTHAIENQFFYGPSLLVSPVVNEGSTSVSFYLPNDLFYDLFTLQPVEGAGANITQDDVQTNEIPVHIRGGSIVPARVNSANTTTQLRELDFELLIAPDRDGRASGSLYLDDGESLVQAGTSNIKFVFENGTIRAEGTFDFQTQVGVRSVTVMSADGAKKYQVEQSLDGPWEYSIADKQGGDLRMRLVEKINQWP